MANWFYVRDGQQKGPIGDESLRLLIQSGEVKATDLAWCEGMADWKPIGSLAEFSRAPEPPPVDPENPYSAPATTWSDQPAAAPAEPGGQLMEIEPGSDPLEGTACISRAWELVKIHAATIVLTGLVYMGVTYALGLVIGLVSQPTTVHQVPITDLESFNHSSLQTSELSAVSIVLQLLSQIVSLFLSLGATRIGLNLVSGKPASVGMIFGEGSKLLRAIGASILYGLMVGLGLILLIFPGIYLALRFGQFIHAIVDRDLGVIESFTYSSRLTTGNRGNLFVLGLLMILVTLAGLLLCGVGLIVAIPITWLTSFIAYRWLQYGRQAVLSGRPLP